jgi:hypothetical protein
MGKNVYDVLDTIREYRRFRADTFYPFDEKKVEEFPLHREVILKKRKRLSELKELIAGVSPEIVQDCKKNLMNCIDKVLELISSNKLGYPLSRNQGLTIPNFVYGKVIGVLKDAMNSGYTYAWSPFYFEPQGDFNSEQLINTLKDFRNELDQKKYTSYFELEEVFENYKEQLLELWREEDEVHPQPEY